MDAHRISVIPLVAIVLIVIFAGLSNLVVAQVIAQNNTSPASARYCRSQTSTSPRCVSACCAGTLFSFTA